MSSKCKRRLSDIILIICRTKCDVGFNRLCLFKTMSQTSYSCNSNWVSNSLCCWIYETIPKTRIWPHSNNTECSVLVKSPIVLTNWLTWIDNNNFAGTWSKTNFSLINCSANNVTTKISICKWNYFMDETGWIIVFIESCCYKCWIWFTRWR